MKRFIFLLLAPIPVTVLAQTETTEWWVNGEVYATTSCETGGDISVPTNPSKKGYTFQGWETAVYDMSTLDTSIVGQETTFDSTIRKWRANFVYGTVYGESLCSPTNNAGSSWYVLEEELDVETGSGLYCYCQVIEFIPTNGKKIFESLTHRWVFRYKYNNTSNCTNFCTRDCVFSVRDDESMRTALYSSN